MRSEGLLGARRLKDLFERHDIKPKKSLGQNFVVDPNTIRKVLDAAGVGKRDRVLEIGPGAGSLTVGLASAASYVTAIEIDLRMLPVLEEVLGRWSNVSVVFADALELDVSSIEATKVVANLPYKVATPVVLRLLEEAAQVTDMVVMTQKEVGERLGAAPGSKIYGAPTVAVAFFARARVMAPISRRAFWPVPNVDSVLVQLTRRAEPLGSSFPAFREVVRAAFGQRRKSLRNSLAVLAGSREAAEEALLRVDVDPSVRAEQVSPEAFARIAPALVRD